MRKFFIISFCVFFCSCTAQREFAIDDLFRLKSTHTIDNDIFLKAIDEFLLKEGNSILEKGGFVDLYIRKNGNEFFTIQFSKSDFNLEKSYRSQLSNKLSGYNRLKGYLKYKGNLLVLQGEVNDFFDCVKPCKVYDIFYKKEEIEGILPMYEPTVYEFELSNGNLKFIGTD